jgi:hypothetical protein
MLCRLVARAELGHRSNFGLGVLHEPKTSCITSHVVFHPTYTTRVTLDEMLSF